MELAATVAQLMAGETLSAAALRQLVQASVDELSPAADAAGESLDYVIEAMLEAVASQPTLLQALEPRIAGYWLRVEAIPGGTPFEVVVRAAECLAAFHTAVDTDPATLEAMAADGDWRLRLVAAWTARDRDAPWAAQVRAALEQDPFIDDDGVHLIREGAGFYED